MELLTDEHGRVIAAVAMTVDEYDDVQTLQPLMEKGLYVPAAKPQGITDDMVERGARAIHDMGAHGEPMEGLERAGCLAVAGTTLDAALSDAS